MVTAVTRPPLCPKEENRARENEHDTLQPVAAAALFGLSAADNLLLQEEEYPIQSAKLPAQRRNACSMFPFCGGGGGAGLACHAGGSKRV